MNFNSNKLTNLVFILINFCKYFCKKYLPFWFIRRIRVVTSAIIDSITFLLIYLIFKIEFNYILAIILGIWTISSYIMGRYNIGKFKNIDRLQDKKENIQNLIYVLIIILLFSFFIYYFIGTVLIKNTISLKLVLLLLNYSFISYLIQYLFIKIIFLYDSKNSNFVYLGSKENFSSIKLYIKENKLKLNLIKINSLDKSLTKRIKIQGLIIDDIKKFSSEQLKIVELINNNGIKVFTFLDLCENLMEKLPIRLLNHDNVIKRNYFKVKNYKDLKLKRIGDIVVSILLLTLTSPIILLSSLAIYLEDKGPILYFQDRTGYRKKTIKIWKLRTMYVDSEKNGLQWSKRNDQRITKIGNWLRIMRIDELPQLISVLKGEMSLIGPRPERPEIDHLLIDNIPFYDLRYSIRPGLSGWAQVNYPYGASLKDSEEKLSYDLYYLANFSFLLDFVILLKTIKLVLSGKGAIAKQ